MQFDERVADEEDVLGCASEWMDRLELAQIGHGCRTQSDHVALAEVTTTTKKEEEDGL